MNIMKMTQKKTCLFEIVASMDLPWREWQVWICSSTSTRHIRSNHLCAADVSSPEPASEPALKSLENGSELTESTKK